ncbi:MAG: Gfo/Idh/MocA family oxidoreductase [Candidatus Hydrogenedentota bacterium]
MSNAEFSRRAFLAAATVATTVTVSVQNKVNAAKVVPGKISPNEKLNIAAIGTGGKGGSDTNGCKEENIIAVCDVDWDRAERTLNSPHFEGRDYVKYTDYRNMLDDLGEKIDAVTITTPDHTHAPAAYMAMKMGIHCYVQKPLTHTVAEARLLKNVAAETGVVTQMGNQGHSGDGVRQVTEMLETGAIGQVREAHVWTHRPVWRNQGMDKPLPPMRTPENMDWDRWIGAAQWRPYNKQLAPHDWRAWRDFGGGALGDMACHIMDPVYMSLNLVAATEYTVEVIKQEGANKETFPLLSTIKYSFPARGKLAAIDVYWYDGHVPDPKNKRKEIYNRPNRPKDIPLADIMGDDNKNGSLLVGDDGYITMGEYGGNPRLLPDAKMADYTRPDPYIKRVPNQNHYRDWLAAIHNGTKSGSDFSYAGPFTEMVNFGNLVVVSGKKLKWDNVKGVVKNVKNPEEIVSKEYRKGWELPC